MAAAQSAKGDQFRADAVKAMNKSSLFSFGSTRKYEDAADLFVKAANSYKLANQSLSAGDAYLEAAEAWSKVGDNASDVVSCVAEAAQQYRKIDPAKAVDTYRRAIDMYNDAGRMGMSSRYCKEMAEVFEADNNQDGAMAAYQEAAELFNMENKKQNANQCLLKIAVMAADKGDFLRAGKIYEDSGKDSMGSKLGAYAAKGHFFNALLCFLAMGDCVQVTQKSDEYKNVDYSFGSSRECGFIEKILQAAENHSSEEFSDACAEFDRITPLDPWKTSLLLKAKKMMADEEGGEIDLS